LIQTFDQRNKKQEDWSNTPTSIAYVRILIASEQFSPTKGYCHFSFMTSNKPVVKIGKEHSHRYVGNQRCFLSNSLLDLGITTPEAYGNGGSQQQ